jgi:FkbH-like protein
MTALASLREHLAPSPASYLQAARKVTAGEIPGLKPLKMAVLSTISAQVLQPFIVAECAFQGLQILPWFAPFGQLEESVLDTKGPLYSREVDAIVVLARIEELAPKFCEEFSGDDAGLASLTDTVGERLRALLREIRARTSATILLANFPPLPRLNAGLGDAMRAASQTAAVQKLNRTLGAICREMSGAFVFDLERTVAMHGLQGWHDPRLFALARQPWSVPAQIAVARTLARTLRATVVAPAKCLVLDADNTLWGGIIGEDGLGGIALGDEYPGNVFKAFQKYLRVLKDRGVLLALVSKNEEADVLSVLGQHRDCVLRESDFAVRRVNWQEKSANLREVAAALNLGLDALVFFDDNPFEREEVKRVLPEVVVLDVPKDPLEFIATIEDGGWFDQLVFSAEDEQRSVLYRQQAARTEASQTAASPEEFLAGLEMVATIGRVGPETLPRVAQLLAKTNQFNLTTRRHSAAQIAQMIEAGAVALWMRLADRFGDHGLVGVAIAQPIDGAWTIDTFLLSCRVIGRHAETALLAQLAACVQARGGTELTGEYLPSARNSQVARFYPSHGFNTCGENRWKKVLCGTTGGPSYISVQFHE